MDTETAAARLEALGSPQRLAIYRALVRAGPDGLPVGAIQTRLDIPASTLSHHLQRLEKVALITRERRRTSLICRPNFDVMHAVMGFLADECCADAAAAAFDAAEHPGTD
jgi:DNA-binding transcriptional ArsR family regulator